MSSLMAINKSILLFFFSLSFQRRRKDSDMHRDKPSRLALFSSILCLLAMLLSGCGQTSTSNHQKASNNKQILVSGSIDINSFHPARASEFKSSSAIKKASTVLGLHDVN